MNVKTTNMLAYSIWCQAYDELLFWMIVKFNH